MIPCCRFPPDSDARTLSEAQKTAHNQIMEEANRNPPLGPLFMRWARDSVRARGLYKSFAYLAGQLWSLLCDSMPERRRSRFGDIDYDCDYGVDTTWARLSWGVRLRELFTERLYQPTAPDEFTEMMQQLARVDFTRFTFVDLGSGKGRALLLAAGYPFQRIIGVEVQAELHAIAEENLSRLREQGREIEAESICLDAREFIFPPEPLLVYLFNPFPDYVLASVIENLRRSLACHPRPLYVIYNTPYEQHVLDKTDFLRRMVRTHQYLIYEACVGSESRGN
jgi:SAM-dependent methyltransferase